MVKKGDKYRRGWENRSGYRNPLWSAAKVTNCDLQISNSCGSTPFQTAIPFFIYNVSSLKTWLIALNACCKWRWL